MNPSIQAQPQLKFPAKIELHEKQTGKVTGRVDLRLMATRVLTRKGLSGAELQRALDSLFA